MEPEANTTFLAHVRQVGEHHWIQHALEDHLRSVARLAAEFASPFGNSDWAQIAGLWHDLGKYQNDFQLYIKSASGYDAHIEAPGKVDHSTAGAIHAIATLGAKQGRVLAYLIAGHHAGLADWEGDETGGTLYPRLQKQSLLDNTLRQPIPADILNPSLPMSKPPKGINPALWIRMLFSCLVDADFLDTEQFMDEKTFTHRNRHLGLVELAPRFDEHMQDLATRAQPTLVNRVRTEILQRCQAQASQPPGLFSLNVPTGGGKTLSSMAFALRHALQYDKQRIIYVIPYTSIIEQTADVFRGIFGDAVVEHHSNLDAERETPKSRLACENWDAPIIVTTAVQFFESLFAVRTSRVRKLHNITNSVVVLDEAQLLPPDFLKPILHVIDQLQRYYGVSFVFSTATQPAFHPQKSFDWEFDGLPNILEIIEAPQHLHTTLKRVEVTVPQDLQVGLPWEALAEELQAYESVLCIVDRRDDCRALHALMPNGTIHLSGLMCGQHRSEVIADVKRQLEQGNPVRVISTQLVEAGVDVDFPVVYRALTGLDSMAQAAGRCNREGKLTGRGRVVVFVPPKPAPIGHLRQAQDCGRQLLQQRLEDPLSPEHFTTYFRQLYWKKGGTGWHRYDITSCLTNPELKFAFRSAARRFHIIDETRQAPVIVRYKKSSELIGQLQHLGPERWLMRRLQRYVVNLPRYRHRELVNRGEIQEMHPGIFVQAFDGLYHQELGLMGDDPAYHDPDDLII